MSSAPHIGITCDFETITDRRGRTVPRFVLSAAYAQAVQRAGGQPWLVPHTARDGQPRWDHLEGLVWLGEADQHTGYAMQLLERVAMDKYDSELSFLSFDKY